MHRSAKDLLEPVARIYGQPMRSCRSTCTFHPMPGRHARCLRGPLDLLLYMIRRANIDIPRYPDGAADRQYLDYVEAMRAQNLELAADYLVMAAMLIEIVAHAASAPQIGGRR